VRPDLKAILKAKAVNQQKPSCSWWQTKACRVGATVILLMWPAAYWLSNGPAIYAMVRGWLPVPVYRVIYGPITHLMRYLGHETLANYGQWWLELGYAHELDNR
jgi:hypothetical protein